MSEDPWGDLAVAVDDLVALVWQKLRRPLDAAVTWLVKALTR